jgi:acetoin utilization protein AcuB
MIVRHRMTPNPITIGPHAMLSEAQEKMTTGRFRRLPVIQNGNLVGVLTDRDLRRYLGAEERTKVQAAMTETPLTIAPEMAVEDATQLMLRNQISGLPVVENGKLIGILTASDILNAFLDLTAASMPGSTRINVLLKDNENLLDAARQVQNANGTVLAVGTYEEPTSHQRVFFLRVSDIDAATASTLLRRAGYTVL